MVTSATTTLSEQVAAGLRANMARNKRTGVELATVLRCSQQTASRKMNGKGIDLDELPVIADWLGCTVVDLIRGAA